MRRTVAEAEQEIEALAPGLNPESYARALAEVNAAKAEATRFASSVAGDLAADVDGAREETLHTLCDVRDGLDALRKEGEAGRVSARDYSARLEALRYRQRSAESTVSRLAENVDTVTAIEEDPVGYAERFYNSTPLLKPDFSF